MKMRAKLRETPPCNKHKLTHLYRDAIEKLTNKIARFAKSKSIIFDSWKDHITRDIDRALKCLPNTFKYSHILDKPEVCKHINFLYDRFVIVPVDKASDNFGIVCKTFYLDVIKKELGISNDGKINGNKVHKPVYQEAEDMYKFHEQKLLNTFGMKLLDNNQYIPLLYWTSKQHRCPYSSSVYCRGFKMLQ